MIPKFERQTDAALYPDIFWKRPTMRSRGGRLLIVGGQGQEFSALQAVYQAAEAAGIGEAQAAMPDSLRKILGSLDFGFFLPASNSGSLGKAALGELQHLAKDYDAVVIGANLTNNAETAVMIESLIRELDQKIIFTEEAIEILKFNPDLITGNPHALVVATMPGLFALANHHHMPIAIKPNSGVVGKMEILQQLVDISRCGYVIIDQEVLVAIEGKMSLTPLSQSLSRLTAIGIGVMATFWLQQPTQAYPALTTAAFIIAEAVTGTDLSYSALSSAVAAALRNHDA